MSPHWTAHREDSDGIYHNAVIGREDALDSYRGAGWTIQGPFVPEADYQEAIDLLREANAYVANVADHPPATELLGRIDALLASVSS
jgi:hypothetical protein